jgi:glycosyltransferase involved in cell wall biosynthesis
MKILLLVQLPPPLHGVSLCNEIVKELCFSSSSFESEIIVTNYSSNISELTKFSLRKIFVMLQKYFELIYLIFTFRPDKAYFVISPHGAAFYRDLIFITTLKLARVKLVYHLHGKGIAEKSFFLQNIFRFCFNNADLICLSPLLAKDVENVAQHASISIVMNGVHAELVDLEWLQLEKSSIVDGTRPVRIAMLSNLQWFKGVDYFLHLAKALLQTRTDVEFHLAGPFTATFTSDDYADFQRDLGDLAERFIYHGALYNSEKDRFMSAMDILVHPTRNDALPLVIIEALAAGLMVVATPQGGIPDLLADLVGSEVVAPERITQAVENLLKQKDQFATFAAASRARYLARHTQQAFMVNLQKVLVK